MLKINTMLRLPTLAIMSAANAYEKMNGIGSLLSAVWGLLALVLAFIYRTHLTKDPPVALRLKEMRQRIKELDAISQIS